MSQDDPLEEVEIQGYYYGNYKIINDWALGKSWDHNIMHMGTPYGLKLK